MSEELETEDDSRPSWRYLVWNGWNLLAIAWVFVGVIVGGLADFVLARWLRNEQLHGAVAIAVGVSVVAADLICRSRDAEEKGWRRYVSSIAGGALLFIPAWLVGLGIIATGIAAVLGKA